MLEKMRTGVQFLVGKSQWYDATEGEIYINACCWPDSASSGEGTIVEFCEHGDIPSCSTHNGSCLTSRQKL
jgi:hypothetical protein